MSDPLASENVHVVQEPGPNELRDPMVRAELKIPLIANGDIDSPEKARRVLDYTGADAVMIGRAAQGRPWIFREVDHYLRTGETLAPPSYGEMRELLLEHLDDHYRFYGEHTGVRTARKHIGWYLDGLPDADSFRDRMNLIDNTRDQWRAGVRMCLAIDGEEARTADRFLVMATTLKRLPFGVQPFGPPREGLKFLDVDAPPKRLPGAFPALLAGKDAAWLPRLGYRRGDAERLRITTNQPLVVDGDVYDGAGGLTVTLAPPLRFLAA
jgi:hypothetical protein